MDWLKSKLTIVAVCFLAIAGVEGYGLLSMRNTMEEHFNSMADDSAKADEKITVLSSNLDVVVKKLGVTEQELQDAQNLAKQLKQENAQLGQRLRRDLATKADTKAVAELHKDATTRIDAVHQETTTKIDGITGEVKGVRTDLDTTRNDLNATREEVANSRRDLGTMIARNSSELAELRRKGEREYIEFDITKAKDFKRVGDVLVQLRKTDIKRQKYEVVISADDSAIQKKDRTANEPVTFLVGKDRLRYELVVNHVDKDRIRGYISSPKETLKAADTLQ